MRTPKVETQKVLELLKEGHTTSEVADICGVTRQAIDVHRRKFIDQGLLIPTTRDKRLPSMLTHEEKLIFTELKYIQQLINKRFREAAEFHKLKDMVNELEKVVEQIGDVKKLTDRLPESMPWLARGEETKTKEVNT